MKIFTLLLLMLSFNISAQEIDHALVFDPTEYRSLNSDLTSLNDQAIRSHWISTGSRGGRQARKTFYVRHYQALHPDLAQAYGENWQALILHYIIAGAKEGRAGIATVKPANTNSVLSASVYTDEAYKFYNKDLATLTPEARILHWLKHGMREGRRASYTFHSREHLALYPLLPHASTNDYEADVRYYVATGEKLRQTGVRLLAPLIFNVDDYRAASADIQHYDNERLKKHWILHGGNTEGRRGSRHFHVREYVKNYTDLQSAYGSNWSGLIGHYFTSGEASGRSGLSSPALAQAYEKYTAQRISPVTIEAGDTVSDFTGADGKPVKVVVKAPKILSTKEIVVKPTDNADATISVNNAIKTALENKISKVRLEKGTYNFLTKFGNDFILIRNAQDFIFDGGDSTLVFHHAHRGIQLSNVKRVSMKNLIIDYADSVPHASKGRIVLNNGVKALELIDQKYAPGAQVTGISEYNFVDNAWFFKKKQIHEKYFDPIDANRRPKFENGLYFHEAFKNFPENLEVLVRHHTYSYPAILVSGTTGYPSEDISFDRITMRSSLGMGYLIGNFARGLMITNSVISRKEGRYISSSSDGIHIGTNGGDLIIRNNLIEHQGDDAVNTGGSVGKFISNKGNQVTIANKNIRFEVGDEIGFFTAQDAFIGSTKITSPTVYTTSEAVVTVSSIPANMSASYKNIRNLSRIGSRFVIEGNTFRKNRARGLLFYSPNGLVKNNTIEQTSLTGMIIGTATGDNTWNEGHSASNVIVEGNKILNTGFSYYEHGAITLGSVLTAEHDFATVPLHQNIIFRNNIMNNVRGSCFLLHSYAKVSLIGNQCTTIDTKFTTGSLPVVTSSFFLFSPYNRNLVLRDNLSGSLQIFTGTSSR